MLFLLIVAVLALFGYFIWSIFSFVAIKSFFVGLVAGFATAFVFGTFWFWALVLAESCYLFWCLDEEEDSLGGATASLIVVLGLLQLFGDVRVFSYIFSHPLLSLLWFAGYLIVGAGWSVAKWWFFVKARYAEARERFLRRNASVDGAKERWNAHIRDNKPDPGRHKGRIISWMCYWPWSMLWTLLNDPLKKLFRQMYAELERVYQKISDRIWVEESIPSDPARNDQEQ